MLAKGRDASVLFPAVVKNVVSKNIEIKKLVYVYLERYAEEQQDLALLSIATFQRALKVRTYLNPLFIWHYHFSICHLFRMNLIIKLYFCFLNSGINNSTIVNFVS